MTALASLLDLICVRFRTSRREFFNEMLGIGSEKPVDGSIYMEMHDRTFGDNTLAGSTTFAIHRS